MYDYNRSYWITVLILPTHTFGEAIIETAKIRNLFLQFQIIHILVHWNPPEKGKKTHKFFLL